MFNIRNKINTIIAKQKDVVYWNKDICGFEPRQNKKGTLPEYNKEQVEDMLYRGIVVVGDDGLPKVMPRPELIKAEKAAQKMLVYERHVSRLIREKYSVDKELAIIRQLDSKSEEYREYFNYCEECKAKAKSELQ